MKRVVALGAVLLAGCWVHPSNVTRVYDGRVVEGGFVAPEAYAAYLKGVMAEEAGDLPRAADAYREAIDEDGDDPEPYARLGAVECKLGRRSTALRQALALDRTYAPAIAAKAECDAASGKPGEALADLDKIAPRDRADVSLEALYVKLAATTDARARDRAIALTVASGDAPAAWEALVAWGRAKGEPELVARGLAGLVRAAPTKSATVEAGVLELVGLGQTALAREVAAHLTDASALLAVLGPRDPTVARLAVDEAILRGDLAAVERRSARAHVDLGEAAARALLLERAELAKKLADGLLAADPTAACATMTALAHGGAKVRVKTTARGADACVLVVAERLAALGSVEGARAWAHDMGAAVSGHDPLTGPIAVDLAARGVLATTALPTELRIELAARRREEPPPLDATVDTKHVLLWNALRDPASAATRALLPKVRGGERDPVVGFALARVALAGLHTSATDAWAPVRAAISASPTDPLVLSAAIEIAQRGGHSEEVPPARARLLAVAQTPAERALARE